MVDFRFSITITDLQLNVIGNNVHVDLKDTSNLDKNVVTPD